MALRLNRLELAYLSQISNFGSSESLLQSSGLESCSLISLSQQSRLTWLYSHALMVSIPSEEFGSASAWISRFGISKAFRWLCQQEERLLCCLLGLALFELIRGPVKGLFLPFRSLSQLCTPVCVAAIRLLARWDQALLVVTLCLLQLVLKSFRVAKSSQGYLALARTY